MLNEKIKIALNKFDAALRTAIRRDIEAEMTEEWNQRKLKRSEEAWAAAKAARLELEVAIDETTKGDQR